MTTLLQKWEWNDGGDEVKEIGVVKHLCPWGVKDTYSNLLTAEKCKERGFQPKVIQDYFQMPTTPKYDKKKVVITVTNTGPATAEKYYHVFCRICESGPELLPSLLRKHKDSLGANPNVFSLIDQFDAFGASSQQEYCSSEENNAFVLNHIVSHRKVS